MRLSTGYAYFVTGRGTGTGGSTTAETTLDHTYGSTGAISAFILARKKSSRQAKEGSSEPLNKPNQAKPTSEVTFSTWGN